ncbi:MAG: HK97 family phage prohead protease [Gammaproteobacteria bacterium]|nr:HK97 family phage prohead protease [Gammaproteobacteria bacterium]
MRRLALAASIEIRSDDDGRLVRGEFPYLNRTLARGRGEVFMRGAFSNALKSGAPISLLIGHDNANVIATTHDGLRVEENDTGLTFESRASDQHIDQITRECNGVSVGFEVRRGGDFYSRFDGKPTRIIRDCDLFEISLVKDAAYSNTRVEVRERRRNKWR